MQGSLNVRGFPVELDGLVDNLRFIRFGAAKETSSLPQTSYSDAVFSLVTFWGLRPQSRTALSSRLACFGLLRSMRAPVKLACSGDDLRLDTLSMPCCLPEFSHGRRVIRSLPCIPALLAWADASPVRRMFSCELHSGCFACQDPPAKILRLPSSYPTPVFFLVGWPGPDGQLRIPTHHSTGVVLLHAVVLHMFGVFRKLSATVTEGRRRSYKASFYRPLRLIPSRRHVYSRGTMRHGKAELLLQRAASGKRLVVHSCIAAFPKSTSRLIRLLAALRTPETAIKRTQLSFRRLPAI
ncbi:hypothetical protein BD414DRAFT_279140 [Trametes punicea]|nr:hypothetical protein BD414DRAFT_279140 [Trametes punicea]